MINAVFKNAATSATTIQQALGNMHSNRYYAPVDPQYWPKFAGVASMWGGFAIPKNYDNMEAEFFKQVNAAANPPLIAFHGDKDDVIDFNDDFHQDVNLSGKAPYKTENLCTLGNNCPTNVNGGSFTQKVFTNDIELKICSSLNLYRVMKDPDINQFAELYVDCSMRHGLDIDCITCNGDYPKKVDANNVCQPCTYGSRFGTSATNVADTDKYLAARIAVFSHDIMYNTLNNSTPLAFGALGRSFFKDCENMRTCSQTTENSNCTSSDADTLCNGSLVFPL